MQMNKNENNYYNNSVQWLLLRRLYVSSNPWFHLCKGIRTDILNALYTVYRPVLFSMEVSVNVWRCVTVPYRLRKWRFII
jgi:hypothetical protein